MKRANRVLAPRWAAALLLAIGCAGAQAQVGVWNMKAPMPTPRYALSATSLDGIVYAVGGTPGGCNDLATLEAYDPATDTWTAKAPMPTARSHLATAAVGGKLYAIGGTNFCGVDYAVVEAYDPATNTWSPRAPMPGPRRAFRAMVEGGKIYVMGGGHGNTGFASGYVYDPALDAWSAIAPAPRIRGVYAGAQLGGKLYVMGGIVDPASDAIDVYNVASDTWSVHAQTFARSYADAENLDGAIYVVGGYEGPSRLQRFDGTAFTELAPIPAPKAEHATAAADGVLFAMGGAVLGVPQSALFAYRPEPGNADPVADAGDDIAAGTGAQCHAQVQLDGSASHDPDGDALSYAWSGAWGEAGGVNPVITLSPGTHVATLTVDDGRGGSDADAVSIQVVDDSPPLVAAAGASPSRLWPPNGRLVEVSVTASASDACGAAECRIVAIASSDPRPRSEPDALVTGELTALLRAERHGNEARRYDITVRCTDAAGNSSDATTTVTVEMP